MPFLDPVVLKQYIKEYEKKRTEKLSTTTGYIGNMISSYFGGASSLDVEKTCKGFKKSFVEDKAPKDRITLLLKLGRTGWLAQNLKLTNSIPSLLQSIAKLWMESASDYAKNLAAIRNDMLAQILSDEVLPNEQEQAYKLQVRAELEASIAKLDADRENLQTAWYMAIKTKKSVDDVKKCQAEYDAALRDLAYLGNDYHLLTSARVDELFPGSQYPSDVNEHALDAELNRNDSHKPNPHIPLLLQSVYAELYIKKELSTRLGEDANVKGFETLARKEFNEEAKAGQTTPLLTSQTPPTMHMPDMGSSSSAATHATQTVTATLPGSKAPTPRTPLLPPTHPITGNQAVTSHVSVASTAVKSPTPPVSTRVLTVDTGNTPTSAIVAGSMSFDANPSVLESAAQSSGVDFGDIFFQEPNSAVLDEEEEFKNEIHLDQQQQAPVMQQGQSSTASMLSGLSSDGSIPVPLATVNKPAPTPAIVSAWTLDKVKADFHIGKEKAKKKLAELQAQERLAQQTQQPAAQSFNSM